MPAVLNESVPAVNAGTRRSDYVNLLQNDVALNEAIEALETDVAVSPPTGSIVMWLTASAPTGWYILDGSAKSRTTDAALFALFGTTFGAGDGSTTFNLPDMRQRFPLGTAAAGTGSTLGGTGGAIDHTHVGAAHTHTLTDVNTTVGTNSGATIADMQTVGDKPHTHQVNGTTDSGGALTTSTNNPPFLAVHFIVKR